MPYTVPPRLILKKEAEYSVAARRAKYQGAVLLDVIVDASGKPAEIQVARSLGLGLDESAIEAIQQWRFQPATKDGRPVDARMEVEVIFSLL